MRKSVVTCNSQGWSASFDLPSNGVHASCRIYPIREVPVETEPLTDWLYQRFVEKEELLAHFYETGAFPPPKGQKQAVSKEMTLDPVWLCVIQSLAFASGYMWYNILNCTMVPLCPSTHLSPEPPRKEGWPQQRPEAAAEQGLRAHDGVRAGLNPRSSRDTGVASLSLWTP
ncbi:hypothetical protein Z043_117030, partial [Scleropages formosus]